MGLLRLRDAHAHLAFPEPHPKKDANGGVVLLPLLQMRRLEEGGKSHKIHSLQGATARVNTGTEEHPRIEERSLVVDRDANSCIALYAIAHHMRQFDVHPWRPPLGMEKKPTDATNTGTRRSARRRPATNDARSSRPTQRRRTR